MSQMSVWHLINELKKIDPDAHIDVLVEDENGKSKVLEITKISIIYKKHVRMECNPRITPEWKTIDEEKMEMVLLDMGNELKSQVLSYDTIKNEFGNAIRKHNLDGYEVIRLKELIFDEYLVNI